MYRKLLPLFVALAFLICPTAFAQRLVGSVYGVVVDSTGAVLPGVTITVSSPSLMGVAVYTTPDSGKYRFPTLPPGTYALKAELSGFQTTEVTGIVVNAGKSTEVAIVMAIAGVEEVITVTGEAPMVDVKSSKIAVTMSTELLNNIPLNRDLYDIVNSAPGAISEEQTYRRTTSVHGATVRSNTYAFDGVNMNDPVVMYPLTNINYDVMDEVEMITAAHPAETGYTDGAYINIVTKSGGDEFHGAGTVYFTNQNLAQVLFTTEQLEGLGVVAPRYDKNWFDGSFSIGGPIAKKKLWFFGNARYIKQEMFANFVPWTDPLGVFHDAYEWTHNEKMGFIKLTGQLSEKLRIMGQYNYVLRSRPMYEEPAWNLPFEATRIWDGETGNTLNGIVTYVFDPNTFIDGRIGFVRRWFPIPMQEQNRSLPWMYDTSTGHLFTTARFNETYLRKRFQTGAYLSKFMDNMAGGSHEWKFGIEIENAYGDWDWWRADNLLWYWSAGDPYWYGLTSDGIGEGRIYFYICGPEAGSTLIKDKANRIGFYLQDTATFGRLTINAGIRYDRTSGWKPAVSKEASGNPVSVMLGETLVKPVYGLNPWAAGSIPEWKDIMIWNAWSPRIAMTYDLTGDGKTALRASFARYTEYMMLQYFSTLHAYYPRSARFYWYDTNANQQVDINDTYEMYPYDYRVFDPNFSQQKLDPDTSSPIMDEFIIGFQRELSRDFSIGVSYIYKHKKNIFEDVQYDLNTDRYWYTYDQAPDWYVPFSTIMPGSGEYPDSQFTIYARSNDAPDIYYRATNSEPLFRKYQALEFIFNKRMSNRWQFSGSIVFSKAYGNIGGWYNESWGWSGASDSANSWVNAEGRINIDRPLVIKLFGTYELPKGFLLSAIYRYTSGEPFTRYGYIIPPSSWCAANNAQRDYYYVNYEASGTYRRRSQDILDLRLEKQFNIGGGRRLGVFLDAFNVLGWSNVRIGENDIYMFFPTGENTTEGSVSYYGDYNTPQRVEGIRVVKFSFRLIF
jgi:hypothetical protein